MRLHRSFANTVKYRTQSAEKREKFCGVCSDWSATGRRSPMGGRTWLAACKGSRERVVNEYTYQRM